MTRTFRDIIKGAKDIYNMFEYNIPEERVLLDVLETLFSNRENDPTHIKTIRNELEYVIVKQSTIKEIKIHKEG